MPVSKSRLLRVVQKANVNDLTFNFKSMITHLIFNFNFQLDGLVVVLTFGSDCKLDGPWTNERPVLLLLVFHWRRFLAMSCKKEEIFETRH